MTSRAAHATPANIERRKKIIRKSVDKTLKKLDFQRKLRAYQRRSKATREPIAQFAKKHGFSYKAVWNGVKNAQKTLTRLEQRLEIVEKASKMTKINGSAIHRSLKRSQRTVQSVNKQLKDQRVLKKLEHIDFWVKQKANTSFTFDDELCIELSSDDLDIHGTEWEDLKDEITRIEYALQHGEHLTKSSLFYFRNVSWVNRAFGRKP